MLKITLILLIVSIVLRSMIKIFACSMSTEEKLIASIRKEYPIRMVLTTFAFIISSIATIICLIITIIKW